MIKNDEKNDNFANLALRLKEGTSLRWGNTWENSRPQTTSHSKSTRGASCGPIWFRALDALRRPQLGFRDSGWDLRAAESVAWELDRFAREA
jgi:hypothetical protein